MKYIVLLLVLLGFTGTAFGQYLGDKLPPNTMMDPETGKDVLPPSYIDFYYSNSKFEKYSVIADNYRYVIPYIIPNGTISKISIDCNNAILELDVSATIKSEWLTLALPRQLIDSKLGPQGDDGFMVLVDSIEVKYSDIASEKLRIVIIPISNETSNVKIIGVNYPEHTGENTCNGKHDPPFAYLLSPLKQFKSGIDYNSIQCNDGLILSQKVNSKKPACVTPFTKIEMIIRGWADDDRLLLGCVGERVQKCYPDNVQEYRQALYHYYFEDDESLPTSYDLKISKLHTYNTCGDTPVCLGEFDNGTKIRVQCDYPIHGCLVPFDKNNFQD